MDRLPRVIVALPIAAFNNHHSHVRRSGFKNARGKNEHVRVNPFLDDFIVRFSLFIARHAEIPPLSSDHCPVCPLHVNLQFFSEINSSDWIATPCIS